MIYSVEFTIYLYAIAFLVIGIGIGITIGEEKHGDNRK